MKKINLFATASLIIISVCINCAAQNLKKSQAKTKRLIVIMFDGFGRSYFQSANMPYLKKAIELGFYKEVKAGMPSITNVNNTSICTGTFPDQHGIIGNSYLDPVTGKEDFMENKDLVLAPTLFQKLQPYNIKSALISSKQKTIHLLPAGTEIAISPEIADSLWTGRIGKAPDIYSSEVNYWSMKAALYILKNNKSIGCIYIHTTDYPMHMWPPKDTNMVSYLTHMDYYINQLSIEAPDAILMITADHDLNHKNHCIDIQKTLALQGITIKTAISVEKDKYPRHHSGYGGTSYVYLDGSSSASVVAGAISKFKGVTSVLTREEAASKYHLMPSRIGDLIVTADSLTVFGLLEDVTSKDLPETYRSHGSEFETNVPLIILNAGQLPDPGYFKYNKDLTTWLFEDKFKS